MKVVPVSLWTLLAVVAVNGGVRAEVKLVRAPHGAEVPEVVLDGKGVLHMTYGIATEKGNDYSGPGNSYYVQSRDYGQTFTTPVQLNRPGDTWGGARMERGPKLALGKDGVIHVVSLGNYQKGGGIWYTRSLDGGKTFQASRNLLDVKTGCDNATVAADPGGNVFVLWTDGRLGPDLKSPTASPIFMARSTDNGKTFSKSEAVRHDYPGRACGCCRLEARVGAAGNLYIAFRGGFQSIRDPYLLKGRKTANDFQSIRVSKDNWNFG
jgi:hypothetical protein